MLTFHRIPCKHPLHVDQICHQSLALLPVDTVIAFISAYGLMLSIVAQTKQQLESQNLFSVNNSQLLTSFLLCQKLCCSLSFRHSSAFLPYSTPIFRLLCNYYNFSSPRLPFQMIHNQLSTAFVLLSWHQFLDGSPNSVSYHCRFLSCHLMCTLVCGHHEQLLPGISIVICISQENLHNITVRKKKLLGWNLMPLFFPVVSDK